MILTLTLISGSIIIAAYAWLSLRLEPHGAHKRPRRRPDMWE